MVNAIGKTGENGALSREEIVELLTLRDGEELSSLYQTADRTRKRYMGDGIHLLGIIEFSNYCRKNCFYCGLRRSNVRLHRYRMTLAEILETARAAKALNLTTPAIADSASKEWPDISVGLLLRGLVIV